MGLLKSVDFGGPDRGNASKFVVRIANQQGRFEFPRWIVLAQPSPLHHSM